ncbi:MAG TPA: dihydrolipoamide acetyltransferase family protein, partial [Planctomycetota bacterium]|nr:dihydrolipoamide acetyltransferase family protein [Planctomycetota bacterium]
MVEFKLPDIGEGTVEGEIVRWLVKPGDAVKADQPVVEVMTDKATVELTAPKAGKIVELKAEAGKVAKVGSVIYTLDDAAAGGNGAAAPVAAGAKNAEAAREGGAKTQEKVQAPAASPAPAAAAPADGRKPLATPATRKLAREMGVDINTLQGTGPNGRITDEDVRNAKAAPGPRPAVQRALEETAAEKAPAARPAAPVTGEETVERIPFRGVRKAIAAQMTRSKFTATHYTYVEEVDMTEVVKFREAQKEDARSKGVKLTYLPFIAKAVCAALKKHPILNAELDEKAQEIILKKYYHLGFSIQADAGLSVGVLRHADR